MKLTIDFESRSAVSLKDCGAWVYAEDPTTDIMCLALKADDEPGRIWVNPRLQEIAHTQIEEESGGLVGLYDVLPLTTLQEVQDLISRADIIEAHNCEFERAMWQECFAPKYGLPMLPLEKLRCSLAKASYHALPRGLAELCRVLKLTIQKDDVGHKIMLKMCRPKRCVKEEWAQFEDLYGLPWKMLKEMQVSLYDTIGTGWSKATDWGWRNVIDPEVLLMWHENPEEIVAMCKYCLTDVDAEHEASNSLADLPERELRVWQLDQRINARGLMTDTELADAVVAMVEEHTSDLLTEVSIITNGAVQTPRQTAKYKERVNQALLRSWPVGGGKPLQVEDLKAGSVKSALKDERVQGEARRLLEIRRSLARSSVAKYEAILNRASKDGAVRASLLYHGAGTGRWAGRGIQPQNLPRGSFKDVESAVELMKARQFGAIHDLWGDPMSVAATCLRGMIVARPGKEFTCADYANIEGRIVAWLAGEDWKVQAFRDYDTIIGTNEKGKPIRKGVDLYKLAYAKSFGIRVEDVTEDQRQVGKVEELSLGFQGGAGAFSGMAANYGVSLPAQVVAEVIKGWRDAHPMVCALWKGLDESSYMAVAAPGKAFSYRGIAYKMSRDGRFLMCRLPSGRMLHYPFPALEEAEMPWGEMKTVVVYWTVDSTTNKWVKNKLYGGLATENCFTAETKVVTDTGIKSLVSVTLSDLVWDGVEWVGHGGLIHQGEKEVYQWAGIHSTPDQLILGGNSWISMMDLDENAERECLKLGQNLAPWPCLKQRAGGTKAALGAFAIAAGRPTKRYGRFSEERPSDAKFARTRKKGGRPGSSRTFSRTRVYPPYGFTGTRGFYPGVTTQTAKRIATMERVACPCTNLGGRTAARSSNTCRLSLGGTISGWTSTEWTMIKDTNLEISALSQGKRIQETEEKQRSLPTKGKKSPLWSFGKPTVRSGQVTIQSPTISRKEGPGTRLLEYIGPREVYDLVNCGPRNRFTILTDKGPVIVHNCVQAIARDIMLEGMFAVEAAGYETVLTVHDELLSEHDTGHGSVDEFSTLIAENPPWATGLPISAAGWRGTRYRK